jgi:hypothetical protein
MAEFSTKVKLYLEANSKTWDSESDNIVLRDDGSGAYIDTWNVSGLSKPTDSQIASYETAGNTQEADEVIRHTRKIAYGDIGDQLDLLYKDMVAGKLDATGDWATKIKAVKDANPKG